jgi:nitrate/nitrite transporter NarK
MKEKIRYKDLHWSIKVPFVVFWIWFCVAILAGISNVILSNIN